MRNGTIQLLVEPRVSWLAFCVFFVPRDHEYSCIERETERTCSIYHYFPPFYVSIDSRVLLTTIPKCALLGR